MQIEEKPWIYLKLENLQPTGSFKVRGAGNALLSAKPAQLKNGVWTASAGNMGQALAWYAHKLGVDCTVIVPDDAPAVKIEAITRFGAQIIKLPFCTYQEIQKSNSFPGMKGLLIHPFANEAVLAGNGTIGLEILEDLPDFKYHPRSIRRRRFKLRDCRRSLSPPTNLAAKPCTPYPGRSS